MEEQLINFEEELRKKDETIRQLEEQLKELTKNIDQRVIEKKNLFHVIWRFVFDKNQTLTHYSDFLLGRSKQTIKT